MYAGPFRYYVEFGDHYFESCESAGGRFLGLDVETDPDTYLLVPMARYFITDHLGSTRVIINPDGTIHGRADYLPYGKFLLTTGAWRENNDYLWTGKEQLTPFFEANWYDSGARYLFTNGLFASLDLLAEKYPGISPYAYCAGDPVNSIDQDGLNVRDKVAGSIIGVGTNIIPGTGFLRDIYSPESVSDYNTYLQKADAASALVGGAMITGGGMMSPAGASTAVTGTMAMATVVAAPEGAVATAGGAAVAVTGEVVAAAGAMVMSLAADNAKEGYNRGKQNNGRTNGETASTKRGKEEHKKYNPGSGYILDKPLPSGKRPDAYNPNKGDIRELKPNNTRAIYRGKKQVEMYKQELQRMYPKNALFINSYYETNRFNC